jgi:hypothetical protein
MTTKTKAEQVAKRHGFKLDAPCYMRQTALGECTIDAAGLNEQISHECRGQVVSGYYHNAGEFWTDVIAEIKGLGGPEGICEDPECEFHNPDPEEDGF